MIETYFEKFAAVISRYLDQAENSIIVAVAWLTNPTLIKKLKEKAEENLHVEVLINNDNINTLQLDAFVDLSRSGVIIHTSKPEDVLIHHKFCIIDSEILINGSFNWTSKGDSQNNLENITVVKKEPETIQKFANEFFRIKRLIYSNHQRKFHQVFEERRKGIRRPFFHLRGMEGANLFLWRLKSVERKEINLPDPDEEIVFLQLTLEYLGLPTIFNKGQEVKVQALIGGNDYEGRCCMNR